MADYLIGVDVSSNNSSNWEDDAWDYCWVKATEGKTYKNPEYARQLEVVRHRGKVAGHYHWLNDGPVADQVAWFVSQADVRAGELVAVDWEDKSNPSTAQKDDAIKRLQAAYTGVKVGLYCNRDWWLNHDTSDFYGDYLWIANYTDEPDPGIQASWTFWQYTSSPYDKNRGRFASLAELKAWAGNTDPTPPSDGGVWFSTDYLYPKLPDPDNPNGIVVGDTATVDAAGGLNARSLPGGPQTISDNGEPLVRPTGWCFEVLEIVDGWAGGGSNWYSCDYLDVADPDTPFSWGAGPAVTLDDPTPDPDRNVSYLQGVVRVAAMTDDNGKKWPAVYVVGQDYENAGDLRFGLLNADGTYTDQWMQVNDGGHGQCFHAYRSAAGNLYVWCGEDPAYRYKWQNGKKVSKSSGEKMDFKGCRPVGSHEPWVGFRDASDTKETFHLFDRTDFTGNVNRSKPVKSVTVTKTTRTQQTWCLDADRIYRLSGSTNDNPGSGKMLHVLEVFDWSGACLGSFDLTAMTVDTTSDEPEGLTYTGAPGDLQAGKREGSSDPKKRSYPIWTVVGLP